MKRGQSVRVGVLTALWLMTAAAQAEIEIYLDGAPAPASVAYAVWEPLPTLGVYSDYASHVWWEGRIHSTDFYLQNGAYNPELFGGGYPPVLFQPDVYTYEMFVMGADPGEQFTMDLVAPYPGATRIELYDGATPFEVPVDLLSVWWGSGVLWTPLQVNASGGPGYSLAPGGSVLLDGTASTLTVQDDLSGDIFDVAVVDSMSQPYWRLGGVDIAFGLEAEMSYEALVGGLGLSPGTYELTLHIETWGLTGEAVVPLTIVPEPGAWLMILMAAVGRRRRGGTV